MILCAVGDGAQVAKEGSEELELVRNLLPVEFHPKTPGIYHCRVVLRSPTDLRVYNIEGTPTWLNGHV